MSQEWYVFQNEQQKGPYTWEQLWQQASSGALRPDDMIWNEELEGWVQGGQVPGLFHDPSQAGTAPPSPAAGYTPAAISPPGTGAPPQAAPFKTGSRKGLLVAIMLAAVLMIAFGGGAVYYFFLRDRGLTAAENEPRPLEPVGEPDLGQPEEVIQEFLLATLGSLPGAAIDYDKAKSLMTAAYAGSFDSPGFIPRVYGIQDGPRAYEITDGYVVDSALEYFVWGFWDGEAAMQWLFILQQENGAWKIAGIEIMTPASPGGEEAVLSPFWYLNPVTTELQPGTMTAAENVKVYLVRFDRL